MDVWMNALSPVLGAAAMVGILFIALARGYLKTAKASADEASLHEQRLEQMKAQMEYERRMAADQIERERKIADERVAREEALTSEWKEAYGASQAVVSEVFRQNGVMLEGMKTTVHVIKSLPKEGDESAETG